MQAYIRFKVSRNAQVITSWLRADEYTPNTRDHATVYDSQERMESDIDGFCERLRASGAIVCGVGVTGRKDRANG